MPSTRTDESSTLATVCRLRTRPRRLPLRLPPLPLPERWYGDAES